MLELTLGFTMKDMKSMSRANGETAGGNGGRRGSRMRAAGGAGI